MGSALRLVAFVAAASTSGAALAQTTALFVAATGADAGAGTEQSPFATLARARDEIRALHRSGAARPIVVTIRGGDYVLGDTVIFGPRDGGERGSSVTIRAAPGERVRLLGGRRIPTNAFARVSNPSVRARLSAVAASNVLVADLCVLGMTDLGTRKPSGFGRTLYPSPLEVFFDGAPLTLARWPNDSEVPLGTVVDPGSIPSAGDTSKRGGTFSYESPRPDRWLNPTDAWVSGFLHYGWADDSIRIARIDTATKTITLSAPHAYGLASGTPAQRYHVENVFEELDAPGEWFLDRSAGLLYLWPPTDLTGHEVVASLLEGPLVSLAGASWITFRDLTFEYGRGMGILVQGGEHARIENCAISNFGTVGVSFGKGINSAWDGLAGTDSGIAGCRITNTGAGGIILGGGDRKSLSPASNYATDNEIRDVNRLAVSIRPAILVQGVGATVAHNRISRIPQIAVYIQGNDHRVEMNEISDSVYDARDSGAIYLGRDPSERGIVIRRNYLHDIGSGRSSWTTGVYLDDGESGITVTENVFRRVGDEVFGAVFIQGGVQNRIEANTFIDCALAVGTSVWTAARWQQQFAQGGLWESRLLRDVDIRKPPFPARYPELQHFFGSPYEPSTNLVTGNVAANCAAFLSGKKASATVSGNTIATDVRELTLPQWVGEVGPRTKVGPH